jgi:hypothetical protein
MLSPLIKSFKWVALASHGEVAVAMSTVATKRTPALERTQSPNTTYEIVRALYQIDLHKSLTQSLGSAAILAAI